MGFRKFNNPLSKKILFSIVMVSGLLTFIFTALQMTYEYSNRVDVLEENLQQVERTYVPALKNALWVFNRKQIQILLDSMVNLPNVNKTEITSFDVGMNFSSGEASSKSKYPIEKVIPLNYQVNERETMKLGQLKIYADKDKIVNDIFNRSLFFLTTQFIKTLIISFFILGIMFLMVIRPLKKIRSYLDHIKLNEDNTPLDLDHKELYSQGRENELYTIQSSINRMVNQISEDAAYREKTIQDRIKSSKLQAIGVLTSGVAHDFNNILQGLINLNYLNLKHNKDSKIEESLQKNFQFLNRGKSLVEQLLLFSRNRRPELEAVDLVSSISEVIELGQVHRFGTVKVLFENRLEKAWVHSSKLLLYQVFTNIIANACDAIGSNQGEVKVLLHYLSAEQMFQIEIVDNGPGIPKEMMENIFDPFFTTKEVGKGTGLGLSIVYGIIQDLNGDVQVTSEPGHTCFRIELPELSQTDLAKMTAINTEAASNPKKRCLDEAEGVICLVDDEEEILAVNQGFLEDEGYVVKVFSRAADFLDFFELNSHLVKMVITDYNMPEYTGMDLLVHIKQKSVSTPVFLISGYIDETVEVDRFDGHLVKPVSPINLIEVVQNITV